MAKSMAAVPVRLMLPSPHAETIVVVRVDTRRRHGLILGCRIGRVNGSRSASFRLYPALGMRGQTLAP
jgi:hypothetical protein